MAATITIDTKFEIHSCIHCGFTFGLPKDFCDNLRRRTGGFFCAACGKTQGWYGETKEQKEIKELNQELANAKESEAWYRDRKTKAESEAKHQEARANGYKGQLALMKRRLANGVCPCCNRYFEALHRHMKTRHADFVEDVAVVAAINAPTVEDFDRLTKGILDGYGHATQNTYGIPIRRLRPLLFPEASSPSTTPEERP